MKIVKHRPTLSPLKCDHCNKIWYGWVCTGQTHRIIPEGKTLCTPCWNELDNYLLNHKHYQEVCGHVKDKSEWKKSYSQFFEYAKSWIEDATKSPKPGKRVYSSTVPRWVRTAIEAGKMTPNDEYVYTVWTQENKAVDVFLSLDYSKLKQRQHTCFK